MTAVKGPGLYEFLIESELQQYYAGIKNDLKIQNVSQLKYVAEEDLHQIGMSKPEMRRLKKFFQKHYPQNYIHKFKKLLLTRRDDHPSVELVLPDDSRDRPSVKIPNKHMIPVESIIVNKELGQGEFGVVQQGVWTNDGDRIQVAIKCLSRERMQNNPIEFLKEAAIMHAIDHEHIVRLYGCVLDTNALMLVTELAPLRSLLECLKEPSLRASFPVLSLCDFAIQICDGMQYLEMKRLIHRDLAARNILVFSKHKVKISDFGLSRALGVGKDYYQTNFNVNLKLPIAWCAPECISYLRFTSASDMWAYGVTLWEMFSYGFQPWAALTGHQILEAIDQPNFQRLEQPECCPKEYFSVMLKCWQHDPIKRPRFLDLATTLPECKPEQVQAVQELSGEGKARDQLLYRVGDIITVLDKGNVMGCWKGVLNNGKTGLFNPAHTVSYLGSDLPSSKPGEFIRGDGKNAYSSQRRRLRTDMISSPQGDVKHMGHVGLDGAHFGDIAFLGGKAHRLPQQVVAPYKPQEDSSDADAHSLVSRTCSDMSDRAPLIAHHASKLPATQGKLLTDHEYHEISDEEALESPRSETSFDFGPSLLDEMDAVFRSLGGSPPPSPGLPPPLDETVNVRNELRELAAKVTSGKKKQATVKPISASDSRTLDSAIAMATELAARSMNDLDGGASPPESPRTPTTPGKRKFSFRFPTPTMGSSAGHNGGKTEKRSFSDEAASITDMQSSISDAAREVYSSLVEQPHAPSSVGETNPLRLLRSKAFPVVRPRVRGNKHNIEAGRRDVPKLRVPPPPSSAPPPVPRSEQVDTIGRFNGDSCGFPYGQSDAMATFEVKSLNPNARKLSVRSDTTEEGDGGDTDDDNPIPLPPRDRTRPIPPTKPRHQRKHPLIIPATSALTKMADAVAVDQSEQAVVGSEQDKTQIKCLDDSFEQQIACELAALDDMPCGEEDTTLTDHDVTRHSDPAMTRHSDHVSCEDLLEFACDAPNAKRTRGKARGMSSDEVRIMGKVLGPEVAAEECMMALNASDWDVHRAIKLARLHSLLHGGQGLAVCNQALEASAWDVARAASWVLAYQDQGDTTQV